LGLQNYVFDVVAPADRAKAVAVVSIVNACGWAAGTFLGSWLIGVVPGSLRLGQWELHPVSNLPFIFFISGVLRLLVSGALLHTFHEPRQVEQRARHHLFWELPLLKPLGHLAFRRPTE
jgi:MFS family permease